MMRRWILGIVILMQLTTLQVSANAGTPLPLEIYVYNQAGVPQSVLSRAEQRVTLILQFSGVQPKWLNCSQAGAGDRDCSGPPAPGSVAVQIVHEPTKMRDEIFGAAFLGENGFGSQTDVFYDRINELHRDWDIALPELLGHVMAHEIGHLLLGFNAHSATGIMCPIWKDEQLSRAGRGELLFSGEQSKLIRQRLERFAMVASEGAGNGN